MKIIDRIKEKIALQKKNHMEEVLEKENKSQRKTALRLLSGFFVFMLLFTLLSRAADGLTIAEVETEKLARGNVIHEVNASGEVISDGQQSIRLISDLLIDKVSGKQGQSILAGEEIMSFDKNSSEELLTKLQNELAELNLKKANASTPDEASLITAKNNYENAKTDYENAKFKAEEAIKKAEDAFLKAITDYNKLYEEYEYLEYVDKRWALWTDEPILTDDEAKSLYSYESDSPETVAQKNKTKEAYDAMKAARQKCFDTLETNEKVRQTDGDDRISRERAINSAKLAYDEALKNSSKSSSQSQVDSQAISLDIKKKQQDINTLQGLKKASWRLVSPVDGVLLKVEGEAGMATTSGEIASLSKNSEGYALKVAVTKEQIEWIKEGDEVSVNLMSGGQKTNIKGIIQKIALGEEKDSYELYVALPEGEYLVGENAQMTFTQTSEQYYSCLPISALRSDSNGDDYVLIAAEKNTVLGKEAVAKRVDIEIVDRDTKTMEVSGTLLPEDKVIISSNKSIEKDSRVREIE